MRQELQWLADELERFPREVVDLPVTPTPDPGTVRAHFRKHYDFTRPIPLDEVLADVAEVFRRWNVHVTHPRYFGYYNPSVTPASVMGDTLAALYNPQLAVWAHSPAGNEIEKRLLEHFLAAFGLDPEKGIGSFTSGGAEANHSAVLTALVDRFPDAATKGWAATGARPRGYVSPATHDSIGKIARAVGIGTDAVRVIGDATSARLDPDALSTAIAEDRAAGFTPTIVIATAGATATGEIDPLQALAEVSAREGVWFHVDAAWGGAAILSSRLRSALAGIERADSITFDAHKWLSVPMGAGMMLCRRREPVLEAFRIDTTYMPPGTEGTIDPYRASMQWSRRCIGLKLFLSLAHYGTQGYERMIDHQTEMGERLRERLRSAGWRVVNDTPLPTVCFDHPRVEHDAEAIRAAVEAIVGRGRVWISAAEHAGTPVLRACITSYRTLPEDLDVLLAELAEVIEE